MAPPPRKLPSTVPALPAAPSEPALDERIPQRDPYSYRHTTVLRNHAHTVDPEKLEQLDRQITGAALNSLARNPVRGNFDLPHLAEIHSRIAGNLYPFAGEFRTIGVQKQIPNTDVVVHFPKAVDAPGLLSQILRADVADKNYLQGRSKKEISDDLAAVVAHVHFGHGFRDFNSRSTREFARTLAMKNGYELDWARIGTSDEDRKELLTAVFARTGNPKDKTLSALIEKAIVNDRPDPAISRIYDEAKPPPLPWRGTVTEAVARSAAGSPTKSVFVDAAWEDSRVRTWSPPEVLAILEKTKAAMPQKQADAAEYGVRSVGGAVYHVPSNSTCREPPFVHASRRGLA